MNSHQLDHDGKFSDEVRKGMAELGMMGLNIPEEYDGFGASALLFGQVTASVNHSASRHPSLHFKRIGTVWSVRVGERFRALGHDVPDGIQWFWIGSHADYDKIVG